MAAEPGSALPSPSASGTPIDRVPPHNLDAEVSVIGSMLLSKDAIAEVTEHVRPDDFYRGAHRTMFEASLSLYDRGEPVDPVSLGEELKRLGRLDDVGGQVEISEIVHRVPTPANAAYYARIVGAAAIKRRLIDTGARITQLGYDDRQNAELAMDSAENLIYQLAEHGRVGEVAALKDLLTAGFEMIEQLHDNQSALTGLATGFTDFDNLTSGLQPGNLVILAARPAMGKCAAAGTRVLDPHTGELTAIEELVAAGRAGEAVHVATAGADGRIGPARASEVHANGRQPVLRVRTRLGRELKVTATHPLLTREGWLPAGMLQPGWTIATPRALPYFGDTPQPGREVRALARRLAHDAAPGDAGVPPWVFRLPRGQLAMFLRELLEAAARGDGTGEQGAVTYRTATAGLGRDVQHLLLRFGVVARLDRMDAAAGQGGPEPVAHLRVTDAASRRALSAEVGLGDRHAAAVASRSPDLLAAGGHPRAAPAAAVGDETAADASLHWDEITDIAPAGVEAVYDLTVPTTHNFVADDVVIHNSTLVVNIASHVTVKLRKPVAMFSLEMSQMELVQRILAAQARVDSDRLRTGRLRESDWPKLSEAFGKLADAPLFIDETPDVTMMEIRSKCRRLKQQHGLELVIVDYLQLMQSPQHVESRVQEVAQFSRGMKVLAKELDVPVIALSQLSRKPEDRVDHRPQLADLRESGSLEQDADIVSFIYRDEVYDPDSPAKGEAELIVAKHRNGPIGTIPLAFLGSTSRFASLRRGGEPAPSAGPADGGDGPL